jgi:FkbM family methyltransferase
MPRILHKFKRRLAMAADTLAAMGRARRYCSDGRTGFPIFYIDNEMKWRSGLLLLATPWFNPESLRLARILWRSEPKRGRLYTQLLERAFDRSSTPPQYHGDGFQLQMPLGFPNAPEVVLNDLREIYVDHLYCSGFPYGRPVQEGDVVVDCGANIGAFAIELACTVPGLTILAFEPEAATFNALCANVRQNNLTDRIRCFPYGVTAEEGHFRLTCNRSAFTMSKMESRAVQAGAEQAVAAEADAQLVKGVTIDGILRHLGITRCDLIKMDIEGAEPLALAGAAETIRRYRPKLTIAAYHEPSHAFSLPVQVREICADYNIFVSREAHLYAFL